MDSETVKSCENVDSKDSDINRTLYSEDTSLNHVGNNKRKPCISTPSVSSGSSSTCGGTSTSAVVPPDGGWGWVVVFASFMINFIADGVSLSFGVLYVDFVEYFKASKAKTSWVGSIFLSMPLLAGPVASYLIDRYGCRKMCIIGALLSSVAYAVSIFADTLEFLFFTFTVAGLGLALCYVTSIVIVAYYFEKKRSLATGLAACGTGIGTFAFSPFTIILLEHYAWPGTLLILSGFFLNMMVFGALMRDLESSTKSDEKQNCGDDDSVVEDSEVRLCSSLVQLPTYLHDNLPVEVISELSSKEGGYLNSLLEQHPHLFGSMMENNESPTDSSLDNSRCDGEKKCVLKSKIKRKKVKSESSEPRQPSSLSKLDAAYLRNMKIQRGSITYRGAMLNIHRYRLRASSCPDIYRNSMVTIAEEKSCLFLSDLKELMLEMFDFSNFHNIGYSIFCLSNFLLYACVDVPYVYVPDFANTVGIDKESASFLISVLGVLNCLGVVIVGYVGDKPWLDSSLLYSGFIILSGISLIILPILPDYYMAAFLVGVYGFTISANYTLVPVIIVNLISLDNFTGAYGLLLLVQGVASLIGPPIAGFLFDLTGNYDITFYSTGLCIVISGAMVIPVVKSMKCGKQPSVVEKDLSPLNTRSSKVRFHDPNEINGTDDLPKALENIDFAHKKQNLYIKDSAENSLPLLQESNTVRDENCQTDPDRLTMYENPLPLAQE